MRTQPDDDRALEDAMGSLSVRDDLNGGDQEAALKDLLSSVGDLEDVDPNEVCVAQSQTLTHART